MKLHSGASVLSCYRQKMPVVSYQVAVHAQVQKRENVGIPKGSPDTGK